MTNKETTEFFEALRMLEKEKGIPHEYMTEKIRAAIVSAVNKDYDTKDNVSVVMDAENNQFTVAIRKEIVDEVEDPKTQILPDAAAKYTKKPVVGESVEIKLEPKQFGRVAAQAAKHTIHQGIREAEKTQQFEEYQRCNQELVTALVRHVDPRTGNATVEFGKGEAVLPKSEQIEGETIVEGSRIKVYVVNVKSNDGNPRMLLSRTHPGLVKRLFEMEVPEIFNGVVEIKAISREAGSRTKLAVLSHDENVNAISACIGVRGARIAGIVEELGGEKIDVIEYSDDPVKFISAALSPAKVVSIELDPNGEKACRASVPDNQLSLAIGNKGQNARLAVRLTGWKIDIRPESGFFGEEPTE